MGSSFKPGDNSKGFMRYSFITKDLKRKRPSNFRGGLVLDQFYFVVTEHKNVFCIFINSFTASIPLASISFQGLAVIKCTVK